MKKLYTLMVLFGMLFCSHSYLVAQDFSEVAKLVSSDRGEDEAFGSSVSISGDYAIVGVPYDDEDTSGSNFIYNAGSAFIFERDSSGKWNLIQKVVASDRRAGVEFGSAVSISDSYAIVASPLESYDALGGNLQWSAGAAYVFERDSSGKWTEVQKIVASDRASGDHFGGSVSISGNYIVVGAKEEEEDTSGMNTVSFAGSAYIFKRDSSGYWNQSQKIVASDRAYGDFFGWSVSISGNFIVVGAPYKDENAMFSAGFAYLFEQDSIGKWQEVQKLASLDKGDNNNFGFSTSISGNYAIVGARGDSKDPDGGNLLPDAGAAYLFERDSSGNWNHVEKLIASDRAPWDYFGYSVSISGNSAIIGAEEDQKDILGGGMRLGAGSAYIFNRDSNGSWNQSQKLIASDRGWYYLFGHSVSISNNYIIIGANWDDEDISGGNAISGAGAAYVFCPYTSSSDTVIACGDYFWKGNKYTISGIYKDTISNHLKCDSIITLNLTINSVDTSVNINTPMLVSNQFNAGYQWIDCGNGNTPITGETNQSYTATSNGTYAVIITKDNCSDTSACYTISSIGIMENTFGAKLRVFPNPTAGNISIELGENYDDVSIKVINITGQVVFEDQVMNSQFVNLNLRGSPGLYLLHLNSSSGERAVIRVLKSE